MVELLGEAEQELRSTVPAETPMERAAAWESLEHRISGPATVVAFPMRWAAAYAAAAALGFAVLSGVVGNDLFAPEKTAEIATLAQPLGCRIARTSPSERGRAGCRGVGNGEL